MVDIHSHILPGVDDGIATMEDSIEVVKEAKAAGFDTIVATSHYSIPDGFVVEENKRIELLNELQSKVPEVKVLLGTEIYVNGYMDKLIEDKKASTMNNTKYVLFELPLRTEYPEAKNTILNLISKGYKIILAHPERYASMQRNPKQLEELIDLGVYLQANLLSIIGFYGKEPQKLAELLFKHNMISFIGTDIHRKGKYYPNVGTARMKITSIIGEEGFKKIAETNPKEALNNINVSLADYTPIKKSFLGSYK